VWHFVFVGGGGEEFQQVLQFHREGISGFVFLINNF
jgi:hypothetical protein